MSSLLPRGLAFLLPFLFLLYGGCATAPPVPVPAAQKAALERNRRGVDKELAGEHDAALAEFAEALRLHTTVEDRRGMAVALLNIARSARLKGDLSLARLSLDRASALEEAALAAELYFERGKIELATGNLPGAEVAARAALAAPQAGSSGRYPNLLALVLFRSGAYGEAREAAERALRQSREAGEQGEEGNALRLLGDLALQERRGAQATQYYSQALVLDKALGHGRKIAADLRGVAKAAHHQGDNSGALAYFERACEVSRANGDTSAASGDLAQMAEIYDRMGDAERAREKRREGEQLRSASDASQTAVK